MGIFTRAPFPLFNYHLFAPHFIITSDRRKSRGVFVEKRFGVAVLRFQRWTLNLSTMPLMVIFQRKNPADVSPNQRFIDAVLHFPRWAPNSFHNATDYNISRNSAFSHYSEKSLMRRKRRTGGIILAVQASFECPCAISAPWAFRFLRGGSSNSARNWMLHPQDATRCSGFLCTLQNTNRPVICRNDDTTMRKSTHSLILLLGHSPR